MKKLAMAVLMAVAILVGTATTAEAATVTTVKLSSTKAKESTATVYAGNTFRFKLSGYSLVKSGKPGVVSVVSAKKGTMKAEKAGTSKVTFTVKGQKRVCTVTVVKPSLNAAKNETIGVGESKVFKLTGATIKKVAGSKGSVATVKKVNGTKVKVTAKAAGTTKVTVTDVNGRQYSFKVSVPEGVEEEDESEEDEEAEEAASTESTESSEAEESAGTESVESSEAEEAVVPAALSATEITMKVGETYTLTLEGATVAKVYYSKLNCTPCQGHFEFV